MLDRLRILIADPDGDTVELYKALFGARGADGRGATSGAAALAYVGGKWAPHALVTHLRLPDTTGLALATAVRNRSERPLAVLGTTSDARPRTQLVARAAGFSVCLLKPIELDTLCAEIQRAVKATRTAA
jgi:CheY-like chemotaxis protein